MTITETRQMLAKQARAAAAERAAIHAREARLTAPDDSDSEYWAFVKRTAHEVSQWPKWKRGER